MGQSATFIRKGKIFVGKEICAKSEKYRQRSFHASEVYRSIKVQEVLSTPVSTPKEGKWSASRCSCFSSEKGVAGTHYRDSRTYEIVTLRTDQSNFVPVRTQYTHTVNCICVCRIKSS